MNKEREELLKRLDNTHILLWLLKDLCWVSNWNTAGAIMVIPTIGMALFILFKSPKFHSSFFYNMAVTCWILANSAWMLGEMYFMDTASHHIYLLSKKFAYIAFFLGIGCIAYFKLKVYWLNQKA
jgi:hypothetical protein